MTPGARLQAAIELLDEIDQGTAPADAVLSRWARGNRFAGGGDRRAIREVVYAVIRRRRQLDWWGERVGVPANARSRVLAALVLVLRWEVEVVRRALGDGPYAAEPASGTESAALDRLADAVMVDPAQPRDVRLNVPAWLDPLLVEQFGDGIDDELAALAGEATVDLRVNTLKASREEAIAALAEDGIVAEPTPYSPIGLRLEGRTPLGACRAFREGLVEPQDEGSQLVALLTDARPGGSVLDLCAGAGGKTLALAAAMGDQGRVLACDTAEGRLRRGRPRRERAGVTIVDERVLASAADPWIAANGQGFDRVLVDAPCSGSGAWRRNPETKWRLTEPGLKELIETQSDLLNTAALLVSPRGRILYATCSVLPSENECVVEAFLARNAGFRLVPLTDLWPVVIGGACPAGSAYLMLTPFRHGTDGFFVAVMEQMP